MSEQDADAFEKRRQHQVAQLTNYVYQALAGGDSLPTVKKNLVYKGVDEATAVYVVEYIYQKKRWQIAWERASGGLNLVVIGLINLFIGIILFLLWFYASRILPQLFTTLSGWLATIILIGALFFVAVGLTTGGLGIFRLMTASHDSMQGCLLATLIGLIGLLLLVVVFLLLRQWLPPQTPLPTPTPPA